MLNHISTQVVPLVTEVKRWCGNKPSFNYLCVFGCVVWAHIFDNCKKKLDAKNHACNMMGYYEESKAYQMFDHVK
jgi:hypothetical protein